MSRADLRPGDAKPRELGDDPDSRRVETVPASSPLRTGPRSFVGIASVAIAVFAGLVILLYATSIHSAAGQSDKATTILVGQAIGSGNLLLHGWTLPPGNYWTTDSAFYAAAVDVFGLRSGLLFSEPAVVGALTIAMGAVIARERQHGSAAVAGAAAVGVLLVFAPPAMALWFVGNGFHIATALYALLAFWALRRARFGWQWLLAVTLIAFGMLGDLEMVVFAAIPVGLAGLATVLRTRRLRSGVTTVAAAVTSVVLGDVAGRVATALGAFRHGPSLPRADEKQIVVNLGHVVTYGADLLGITNGRFGTGGVPRLLLDAHVVTGLVVVACLAAALARLVTAVLFGRRGGGAPVTDDGLWRLDDLLLFATVSSAALFVILAGPNGVGIHFLSVPVVFADVLAGRTIARIWPLLASLRASRPLAVVGVAASAACGAGLGYELSLPPPVQPVSALTTWLEGHHLHYGLGGYWTAAITTVESGGSVEVRPTGIAIDGHVKPMSTQSSSAWYSGQRFEFYVSDVPPSGTGYKSAVWTWGAPTHVYTVGRYRVLVWGHPLLVSTSATR